MKILFVTVDLPYPSNNGNAVAVFGRLKELSRRGHEVHFYCPLTTTIDSRAVTHLGRYCKDVRLYPVSRSTCIMNLLRHPGLPIRTARRLSLRMQCDIKTLLGSGTIDIAVIEHSNMVVYFRGGCGALTRSVVVLQALVHKSFARDADLLPRWSIRRAIFRIEAARTLRVERLLLGSSEFSEYWFYSQSDLETAAKLVPHSAPRFYFLPIGVEARPPYGGMTKTAISGVRADAKMILLVGCMENPSNEDAARWFAADVLPRIRRSVPAATFVVVGRGSAQKLSDIASETVIVVGEVGDLGPYLQACDVYVVPQRGGAGVRTKLLDGLSAARPVVSTPVGTEALADIEPDRHYLLARDAAEFACKVVMVLREPEQFQAMARSGFEFFQARFSEQAAGEVFAAYMQRVLTRADGSAPARPRPSGVPDESAILDTAVL